MTIADFVSSLQPGTEFGLDEIKDQSVSEIMSVLRYLNDETARSRLVKVRSGRRGQTARWRKT